MKLSSTLMTLLLLFGCSTVNYVPPEESTNSHPLNLTIALAPRVLNLGSASLSLDRRIDEHSELPFLEDGGDYTTRIGGHYVYRGSDGHQSELTIVKKNDVHTNSGATFSTTLSTLAVELGVPGQGVVSRVTRSLGTETFLILGGSTPIEVTLEFRGVSGGKAVKSWNQPTALVFSRLGVVAGTLSLGQQPVYYGAAGTEVEPTSDVALAVLVAYECLHGPFDSTPVTLPERLD